MTSPPNDLLDEYGQIPMDYSNKFLMRIRRYGQALGILRPFLRLFRLVLRKDYEDKFSNAMLSRIRTDDIVWDIGANVGFFTRQFSALVGPNGSVVAFEPSRSTFKALSENAGDLTNASLQKIALSDFDGVSRFSTSDVDQSTTNKLLADNSATDGEAVEVRTAASFARDNPRLVPNHVKIDVEGYELEVLKGFGTLAGDKAIRSFFIEVHFLELNKRGLPHAPAEIADILKLNGFTVGWVDPSHLVAERKSAGHVLVA
jgi:FkbM family methyltransferase